MGSQITKNNHYVPQFYLRNWSTDGNTLYLYRTLVSDKNVPLWTRASIEHVASHQHLYTIMVDGEPNDYYEKWFNSEFETPAQSVLEKVIHGSRLTHADYELLIQFLAVQMVRTPKWYEAIKSIISDIFPKTLENTVAKLEEYIKHHNSIPSLPKQVEIDPLQFRVKIKPEADTAASLLEVQLFTGQKMWLTQIQKMLPKIISVFKQNTWCILESAEGVEYPTRDDPVVCTGYRNNNNYWFKGVGINQKHVNIFMPLTPKHLLFAEVGRETKSRQINTELSTLLCEMIIKHTNRGIYSTSIIKGMLALHPRIVNPSIYKAEQELWNTWHESQRIAEHDWDSEHL